MAGKSVSVSGKKDLRVAGEMHKHKPSFYFKLAHIKKVLKSETGLRISKDSLKLICFFMTFLIVEIYSESTKVCKSDKKKKISPRHINIAIGEDEELHSLFNTVLISGGGNNHTGPSLDKLKDLHLRRKNKKIAASKSA